MTVKDLREILANYPDDMEVLLLRPECEDYEEFCDPDIDFEVNDDNQLVIV